MSNISEVHELSITIPVFRERFFDEKEVGDLFDYVYKLSRIYNISHYPSNFKKTYERGDDIYKFVICVDDHNAELIPKIKGELEELVSLYNRIEKEYLRYRVFGKIESAMIIRRGTLRDD